MNQFPYWNLFYIKSMMICILFTAAVQPQPPIQGVNTMNFTITSPAFQQDRRIPDRFTCEGEDISPRLEYRIVPAVLPFPAWIPTHHPAPGCTGFSMTSQQTPEAWMRGCQNLHNWKTTRSRVPAGGWIPSTGWVITAPARRRVTGITAIISGSMPWIWKPCLCRLTPPGSKWKMPWRVIFSEQRKPWALFPGNLIRILRQGCRFRIRIYLFLFFVVISAVSPF